MLKEKAASLLSVPKEIILDTPLVIATGRDEINVENYKNIIEFTDKKIRLGTKAGTMTIEGDNLKLRQITTENILVSGKISGITYL